MVAGAFTAPGPVMVPNRAITIPACRGSVVVDEGIVSRTLDEQTALPEARNWAIARATSERV
jgi:hypothetical protein